MSDVGQDDLLCDISNTGELQSADEVLFRLAAVGYEYFGSVVDHKSSTSAKMVLILFFQVSGTSSHVAQSFTCS